MFHTLGRNGVNIRAIAQGSSEKNISTVIATADVRKSINILHEEFFETSYKQVNLFIKIGTGTRNQTTGAIATANELSAKSIAFAGKGSRTECSRNQLYK